MSCTGLFHWISLVATVLDDLPQFGDSEAGATATTTEAETAAVVLETDSNEPTESTDSLSVAAQPMQSTHTEEVSKKHCRFYRLNLSLSIVYRFHLYLVYSKPGLSLSHYFTQLQLYRYKPP